MSATYNIIIDEQKLREYIEWLPDASGTTKYYCCLFARKKYCPDVKWIKSDKGQLGRFLSDKERLFNKIEQLEVKMGAYKLEGKPVPQEALALYISPNPRDMQKATLKSIVALAKLYECQGKECNPHQEVMSEIQKTSTSGRELIMFDLDWKDEDRLKTLIDVVDGYCDVTETRGGYHMHVHSKFTSLISEKLWYKKIAEHSDQTGDIMSCPVGTYQGGHVVDFKYRMNV